MGGENAVAVGGELGLAGGADVERREMLGRVEIEIGVYGDGEIE